MTVSPVNPTSIIALLSMCISAISCLFTISKTMNDKGTRTKIDIEVINTKLERILCDLNEYKQDIKSANKDIQTLKTRIEEYIVKEVNK